jgi:N-acetylglutamate synthase-like GNAT family acetyltransferase
LRVIVCSGDGSILMNLGSLVTITAEAPANLVVLLFDNGVYEVTGGQPTPGAALARVGGEGVDFTALARASGFRAVHRFADISPWRADARQVLDERGPVFIALDVAPVPGGQAPHAPRPGTAADRAQRFMAAVAARPVRELFSVRRALPSDAADIAALIATYVGSGSLLPRSESFVADNADDFLVAVEGAGGERVVGCGHLEEYAPSLAELRSLAVHPERKGVGIGRAVAAALEDLARRRQYRTLFAVSNDESFFLRQGFERRGIPELDKERSAVSKFKGVFAKTLD